MKSTTNSTFPINPNLNYFSTEYMPVSQKLFPAKTYKHSELRQLKKYILEKKINLDSYSTSIHFCQQIPTLVSVFSETEIFVYDIITKTLQTKFPKINDKITYGTFRDDGKVILTGTELGKIFLHDIVNKICLRKYNAHSLEITSIDVNSSLVTFVSTSKDCSFKVFEMANEKPKLEFKKAHDDYLQTAKFINDNSILTGGYDKLIKLWDLNEKKNSLVFNNENICEDILVLNDKNYFLSTSDNGLFLYDIRNNKNKVKQVYPVQSTIKKLITDNDNSRLFLSMPNESFIKVLNLKNNILNPIYSLNLKDKINCFDISKNLDYFAYSNENCEVYLKRRNISTDLLDEKNGINYDKEEKDLELLIPANYAEKAIVKNYKYFNRGQYTKNIENSSEILVQKNIKKNLKEFDYHLKQFKFKQCLDSVLKSKNVDQILGVIEELMNRNVLKLALMNRNEEEVENVLNFILWKINDQKAMGLLIYVFNLMIELYAIILGKNDNIKKIFLQIKSQIEGLVDFQKELITLNQEIELLAKTYNHLK